MKQHIRRFLEALRDTTGKINPIYRRNFRELLKVIPLVGSWIDANTMGAIEDAVVEERLSNLDMACAHALSSDDAEMLFAEITNINSIFFVLLLTNLGEIRDQYGQLSDSIDNLLRLVESQRNDFRPHPRFRFITLSGPSAVGKDCVLDLILRGASRAKVSVEALTKFTTRKKRVVDSKYYQFVSNEQFDLLERSGQLIFAYFKRGERYGFDRTHLFNAAREEGCLFSVFTHFESFLADREFLKSGGITHVAVLLTGDKESLLARSDARLLTQEDIQSRKASIDVDLDFLRDNAAYIDSCFDLVVQNGDGYAKLHTHDQIVQAAGLPELSIMDS